MNQGVHIRRGRGKSQASLAIIEASVRILAEIRPATVRAVCYRLFTEGLIDRMAKSNTDKVSRLLVGAREQGLIPWHWIVDETREAERISTWNNPAEIIDATVRQYRKDYWSMQPNRVEIWSEKGTVRGTLASVLDEFGVTFRVMHGYGSATSLFTAAQDSVGSDKPLTVLYVGDWDPSGLHMSEVDLPNRLERYGGRCKLERIALVEQDIYSGLPYFEAETKSKDPRHVWFVEWFGTRCWELDAMSPVTMRERVATHISELLDLPAWEHAVQIEKAERESMESILGTWQASISGLTQDSPRGST